MGNEMFEDDRKGTYAFIASALSSEQVCLRVQKSASGSVEWKWANFTFMHVSDIKLVGQRKAMFINTQL